MHAVWVVCYFDIIAKVINVHTTVAVFQNLLSMLKIYSLRNINCEFFRTQPIICYIEYIS